MKSQAEAQDTGKGGSERIDQNQLVLLMQVPGTQDDHQAIGSCVSGDGACDPQLPDLYKADDKESVCCGMQHGKHREASKTPERRELMFHGDRKRDDGNQEQRQVEVVCFCLLKEAYSAMYERDRQDNGGTATGSTDHQGGADRFRNARLPGHDKVLGAFLSAWREERAGCCSKRNAQGVTAPSVRKQHMGQDSLGRKRKDELADLGSEHDSGVLASGRIRTWQFIAISRHRFLFCAHGLLSMP